MSHKDINYFTCTLGQAKLVNAGHQSISNINTLIESKAKHFPDQPVVGFARLDKNGGRLPDSPAQIYSFKEVYRGTCHIAQLLAREVQKKPKDDEGQTQTVALLCPSTAEFLFAWLGLIRAGYAVLLIAPQCQPAAIAHLCKICNVSNIFYDTSYEELAQASSAVAKDEKDHNLLSVPLKFSTGSNDFQQALVTDVDNGADGAVGRSVSPITTVAYLHHTSGTSTGLPKPIPQSHRAGVGVLPQALDGSKHATFTTTPLYHGGVADLFRAWTANAMIWLFPGKGVPITARSVVGCLDAAREAVGTPPAKYFSSVPYVLQMVAGDKRGLEYLKGMEIVGVGGAALPQEIGDGLVKDGLKLVSRFGSAECGFLMSSHRDYENDREWQYLRASTGAEDLNFETRDEGLAELVVGEGWPHRAKTNRPDGSFASADLFAPHPSIPSAWKYHSRADSQLTLLTGKKFDPAPLESAIGTSEFLDDVLIFGNGRPFPGALLFRSQAATDMSDEELLTAIAPAVESLNAKSQDHARLARNMLVPVEFGRNELQKSSKGTVLRSKAEETYAEHIENAYGALTASLSEDVADEDVADMIRERIEKMVGYGGGSAKKHEPLLMDTELFSYGIDSVASIQIRYTLRQLLPPDAEDPPLSVVEDCGTVERLAEFVVRCRHGQGAVEEDAEDELRLMEELVEEYGGFEESANEVPAEKESQTNGYPHVDRSEENKDPEGEIIVLTGATGALGAHLLHVYRSDPAVEHIYCLVRGADAHAARERVHKSLVQRGLPGLEGASSPSPYTQHNGAKTTTSNQAKQPTAKVTVLCATLSDPHLGLSSADYTCLASTATTIAHLAWAVNFRPRLRSFIKDHIAGVRHVLLLALAAPQSRPPPTLAFCSSIASVAARGTSATDSDPVVEKPSSDPKTASPLGYSRSKWVAEALLKRAFAQIPRLRQQQSLAILRVGQLSGDSRRGVWNAKEAWPLMLGSVRATGALPDLEQERLAWLPVDKAANGWVEVVRSLNQQKQYESQVNGKVKTVPVFHVLNPSKTPTWSNLLGWLAKKVEFETVSPAEWISRLEKLQREKPEHPALQLLGMWKASYGAQQNEDKTQDSKEAGIVFDTIRAKEVSQVLAEVGPLDEEYIGKVWQWIDETVAV